MLSASCVSVSRTISERAPVCHYPMARCARADAHRTGFSRSGRSEPIFAPLGLPSESPLRSCDLPGT